MKTYVLCIMTALIFQVCQAQFPISVSSRINSTEKSVMSISKNQDGDVIISTDIRSANSSDVRKIAIYGPTFSHGTITVPNDEKNYWQISFDPSSSDPVKFISHGDYTPSCHCKNQTSDCVESCSDAVEEEGIVVCPPGSCSAVNEDETDCGHCDLPDAYVIIDAISVYYNGVQYKLE